jgi:hypothetical protein
MLYDFQLYAQNRFIEHAAFLDSTFDKYGGDLNVNSYFKIEEMNVHWNSTDYENRSRVNLEGLARVTDIVGCDGGATPFPNDAKYNMLWEQIGFFYDLYRSAEPNKPIYDAEWHSADGPYTTPDVPEGHMRQALRLAAYHGMGGTTIWTYTRPLYQHWEFKDIMAFAQPFVINDFYTEAAAIENELPRILPFPRSERDIYIYYSPASHARDVGAYAESIRGIFEGLYFKDVQIGFATEDMLADPEFLASGKVKRLVIPEARYTTKKAFEGIKTLAKSGVPIAVFGDALQADDYGEDIAERLAGNVKRLPAANYDKIGDDVIKFFGMERKYTLKEESGRHPDYIEARFAEEDGETLGYAINLGKQTKKFKITGVSGAPARIAEYKRGQLLAPVREIELAPRECINFNIVK